MKRSLDLLHCTFRPLYACILVYIMQLLENTEKSDKYFIQFELYKRNFLYEIFHICLNEVSLFEFHFFKLKKKLAQTMVAHIFYSKAFYCIAITAIADRSAFILIIVKKRNLQNIWSLEIEATTCTKYAFIHWWSGLQGTGQNKISVQKKPLVEQNGVIHFYTNNRFLVNFFLQPANRSAKKGWKSGRQTKKVRKIEIEKCVSNKRRKKLRICYVTNCITITYSVRMDKTQK